MSAHAQPIVVSPTDPLVRIVTQHGAQSADDGQPGAESTAGGRLDRPLSREVLPKAPARTSPTPTRDNKRRVGVPSSPNFYLL